MTASISSISARTAGHGASDRVAGFGPLVRKDLREWAHSKRVWVILVVTTLFTALTAANAAINAWVTANLPDAETPDGAISLDPTMNFLAAIGTQFFVVVAIFAVMGVLVAERDRGTLAWVASKPVSRGAIWLSKWASAVVVIAVVAGLIPMAATFGLVAVLYGSAGIGTFVLASIGVAASVAFMVAVVLAASTVISNQSAVAAIGFAVFFLPQLLAGFLPVDVTPFLPMSILGWTVGPIVGAEVGIVTPIAWVVSVIALVAFAAWRMDRMEF